MSLVDDYSRFRFFKTLLLLVAWAVFMPLVYFISLLIPFYDSQKLPKVFHKGVCRIIGLSVNITNAPTENKPTLFVSNHVSYLDIFALGQSVPGFFVAKAEVASWPVLNKLARLQNTVFIERKAGQAKKQIEQLQNILVGGNNLILFPEGTSTNGAEVLAFKSSLFASAECEGKDIWVQPVSICYTKYREKGMSQTERDNFAWYATMPFVSHFSKVLGLSEVQVEVVYGDPVRVSDFQNRKECAQHSETVCRENFAQVFNDSGSQA